jgi:hypothetical protein
MGTREDRFQAMSHSIKMSIYWLTQFKQKPLLEFIEPIFDFWDAKHREKIEQKFSWIINDVYSRHKRVLNKQFSEFKEIRLEIGLPVSEEETKKLLKKLKDVPEARDIIPKETLDSMKQPLWK